METHIREINYSKLYKLDDPLANRPFRLEPQQKWVGYEEAFQLFCGNLQPPEAIKLKAYMGGQVTDFLWCGLPPIVCISKKVVELFISNEFTGWTTYPVEVYDKKGNTLEGYSGLAIKGVAGKLDLTRSERILKPDKIPSFKPREIYSGFFFDEKEWDGSDLFRVKDSSFMIVKETVNDNLIRAKVTNVNLIRLTEVELSTNVFDYKKE